MLVNKLLSKAYQFVEITFVGTICVEVISVEVLFVGTDFVEVVSDEVIFVGMVLVPFIVSPHIITESSIILPKYLPFFTSTCSKIPNIIFFASIMLFKGFTLTLKFIVIPLLI